MSLENAGSPQEPAASRRPDRKRTKETEVEKDHESRKNGRFLNKARLAAGAAGAAMLAGFASSAIMYGDDGDIALLPWWL
jgi:hypothetical protein